MDNQQRARELLALGLDEYGHYVEAENVRKGIDLDVYRTELWSITAALRAAPEEFVLVPRELTLDMLEAAEQEFYMGNDFADAWDAAIDTYLAVRPQGVK